jgi:hypothetical protein
MKGLVSGGQVPRHHKPSSRAHARSVAQFPVHERFVALGSHYLHLRTRLGFSPSALVRDSGQHTHAKTTTCKSLFVSIAAPMLALSGMRVGLRIKGWNHSKKMDGDVPYRALNRRLKCAKDLNPTSLATSPTRSPPAPASNRCRANCNR